eukprot:13455114-Ditylum_brightwellii.AAC.1
MAKGWQTVQVAAPQQQKPILPHCNHIFTIKPAMHAGYVAVMHHIALQQLYANTIIHKGTGRAI